MSSAPRPHILFVDDDPDMRRLMEEFLGETCKITSASSAEEALQVLGDQVPKEEVPGEEVPRGKFDLFLLDIRLPGKRNGVELLRLLRDFGLAEEVPAVALTTYAGPENRERLLAEGFEEHVSKPFLREELIGVIDGAIPGGLPSTSESQGRSASS